MHPFNIGQEYIRQVLLDFVGSKQGQTGVIWGKKQPDCLIITSGGRHGKKVGYSDERLQDGCWWYFGQGRTGDHSISNSANSKLIEGQRSILLFTTREPTAREVRQRGNYKKLFAFCGIFHVSGYDEIIPTTGARRENKLLRFFLVPANGAGHFPDLGTAIGPSDIHTLREELIVQSHPSSARKGVTVVEYRRRSDSVRRYALLRARGKCEACGCAPPFLDENGNGYLEVHHILRLADEGVDAPQNVAAICPNCHRRAHYSADRQEFKHWLLLSVQSAERLLTAATTDRGP